MKYHKLETQRFCRMIGRFSKNITTLGQRWNFKSKSNREYLQLNVSGLGIDLGVKEFAVISNGIVKKNINKSARIKKLEKQLKENSVVYRENTKT